MKPETIIIGSGVAATALATKLLRNNPLASILMLEAGGQVKMKEFALFQNYLLTQKLPTDQKVVYDTFMDLPYGDRDHGGENANIGKTVIPLFGSRLFLYGGSTGHWGGWSFRLKPEDFTLKTNTGKGIDWPFGYDELEPYYCEAEEYIGVSGDSKEYITPRSRPYPFSAFPYTIEDSLHINAFQSLGISYSHLPIARHGISDTTSTHAPCQTTGTCKYCPFGARFAAANYLDDIAVLEAYPNFSVLKNVVVEEILMASKSQAAGLRYYDKQQGSCVTLEADQLILAAGAIESPKLLLRSTNSFWPAGIGNDYDLVGRNFITHPYFAFQATLPDNPLLLQPEMNFPTLVSRHFDSEAEQAAGKFILMNPPGSPVLDVATLMMAGKSREEIQAAIAQNVIVQTQGIMEVFSRHENRITGSSQKNRFGMYETIVDYTQDDDFNDRLQAIQDQVATVFEAMGAQHLTSTFPVSWRADHAACTTRMSHSPAEGVVDADLKIHGVDNVYVCSNASFASLGAVNPTLTLTALALRLAEHLLQKQAATTSTVNQPS